MSRCSTSGKNTPKNTNFSRGHHPKTKRVWPEELGKRDPGPNSYYLSKFEPNRHFLGAMGWYSLAKSLSYTAYTLAVFAPQVFHASHAKSSISLPTRLPITAVKALDYPHFFRSSWIYPGGSPFSPLFFLVRTRKPPSHFFLVRSYD